MKKLLMIVLMAGSLLVGSACRLVDPFLIALNLPLSVSATVSGGNFWNESKTYSIVDQITSVSPTYATKVKATRISDILLSMPNPPATGTVSGSITYQLNGGTADTLATFTNVPFDSLRSPGISLAQSSLVHRNVEGLSNLLTAMQNATGLPLTATITVQTAGTTSVAVPAGTQIVATIDYQVDVSI